MTTTEPNKHNHRLSAIIMAPDFLQLLKDAAHVPLGWSWLFIDVMTFVHSQASV
jgi:hypothetical protein